MVAREDTQHQEATQFLHDLYGEDTPGYVSVWTRPDRQTRYVEAHYADEIARTPYHLVRIHPRFGVQDARVREPS